MCAKPNMELQIDQTLCLTLGFVQVQTPVHGHVFVHVFKQYGRYSGFHSYILSLNSLILLLFLLFFSVVS